GYRPGGSPRWRTGLRATLLGNPWGESRREMQVSARSGSGAAIGTGWDNPGMTLTRVTTVDYHTGGEPFRIVTSPVATPGATVADRRRRALASDDTQRLPRFLCLEPRGHADMYGCFLTPPDDDFADFGVLFWHKDGFSTACGHGTIALATWAVDSGRIEARPDGETDVVIDVPSGRVTARVTCADGRVAEVAFTNVPGWTAATNAPIDVGAQRVNADIAYGGAFYAMLPASAVGLRVAPADYAALIDAGRAIKHAADATALAVHPDDDRLSGVYGTILYEPEPA